MGPADDDLPIREWVADVVRRWWLIVAAAIAAASVAAVLSLAQRPVYEAEARVLIPVSSTESLFDAGAELRGQDAARALQTQLQVIKGERVRARVTSSVSSGAALPAVEVVVVGNSEVVAVRVQSFDPESARRFADAYVRAYVDQRVEDSTAEWLEMTERLSATIGDIQRQIAAVTDDDARLQGLYAQQAAFQETLYRAQIDGALGAGGVAALRPATLPSEPIRPMPMRSTMSAGLAGALLGAVGALFLGRVDPRVSTEADLRRMTDVPVIAVVPRGHAVASTSLSITDAPVIDAYRRLRASVVALASDRGAKVVQVTSAVPGEGKSTTAFNLALLLARTGRTVAIVEADVRRPRLSESLGLPPSPGFVDLIADGDIVGDIERFVVTVDSARLIVVPAGRHDIDPGDDLVGQRAAATLRRIADRVDHVIVDSPPVLGLADAVSLAGLVDAVLFVVRADSTSRRQVSDALRQLSLAGAPPVGMVLCRSFDRGGDALTSERYPVGVPAAAEAVSPSA